MGTTRRCGLRERGSTAYCGVLGEETRICAGQGRVWKSFLNARKSLLQLRAGSRIGILLVQDAGAAWKFLLLEVCGNSCSSSSLENPGFSCELGPGAGWWGFAGSMADERPIRPLLRAFTEEGIADPLIDDIFGVQDLGDALLGVERVAEEDSDDDLGLHGMDAARVIESANTDARHAGGLTSDELEALAPYKYTATSEATAKECSVCVADLEGGEDVCALNCLHVFHHACVLRWLRQHSSCPYCRFPVKVLDDAACGALFEGDSGD